MADRRIAALLLAGCSQAPIEGGSSGPGDTTAATATSGGEPGAPTTSASSGAPDPTSAGTDGASAGTTETGGSSDTGSSGPPETTDATTDGPALALRYDEVRQKSAHNAYQRDEALVDQMLVHRVRSLELDIHVGKTLAPEIAGDWYVYHTDVIDDDTSCRTLTQCLGQVAALGLAVPEHEVLTLWIDLKDAWTDEHRPADLDARLTAAFGPSLFTPGDLLAACPGATSPQAAVTAPGCAWPALADLRGRVLVALTGGGLADYAGDDPAARAAFVAPELTADEIAGHPEAAIVNLALADLDVAPAVGAAGLVSRVYGVDDPDAWTAAVDAGAHHLATDKVNAAEDPWATTAGAGAWPFTCLDACDPPASEPGAVLTLAVDSGDLWDTGDDGLFAHWPLAGAAVVTAVIGAPSSHVEPFIKGCVGARAGTDADAAYLAVCRPADDNPPSVQLRATAGGDTEAFDLPANDGLSAESPAFVRLERAADELCVKGFGSADGAVWTEIAGHCFAAPVTHVGVLASSHGAGPARVPFIGLTATPGGPLTAADATLDALGAAAGDALDGW